VKRRVISGLNATPILLWIGASVITLGYMASQDLAGAGLNQTQAYLSLGSAIYPLFYGSGIYGLYHFASMYFRRAEFVSIDDSCIAFGRTKIPLSDIRGIAVERNRIGIRRLVVSCRKGEDYHLADYYLSQSASDVEDDLTSIVAAQRRVTQM